MRTLSFKFSLIGFLLLSGCVANNAEVVLKSISFSPDTLNTTSGSVVQLSPTFYPAAFNSIAVDWSSSDAATVTVSSTGVLYAVKKGTAVVVIKDKNSATQGKCLVVVQ